MNRLTGRDRSGEPMLLCAYANDNHCADCYDCGHFTKLVDRLALYEDTGLEPEEVEAYLRATDEYVEASEEGRLIVLPCKVGDTVYRIAHIGNTKRAWYGGEYVIQEFGITHEYVSGNGLDMFAHMILDDGKPSTGYEVFSSSNIGKTIFLTREEAEAALGGDRDG